MKKTVILIILLSSYAHAQPVDGAMDCIVTGNVVVASEEGKFKTYSSMQGGVKANEKLSVNYMVNDHSIYIELKRDQVEKNIVINELLSSNDIDTTAEKYKNGGIVLNQNKYNYSISFLPDYIRIKHFGEFSISRYYKNDWHGIYSFVNPADSTVQVSTLNCRHANDKMDSAFQIFTRYKVQK
jgi:hypothetical protein